MRENVKRSEYFGYFGYGFGECISFGLVGSFSLYFFTDIVRLTAFAASMIFLIARVWDAVNDPLLASIIDKKHKVGREKFVPLLKSVPIIMALVTLLLFTSFAQMTYTMKLIYCFVFYIIWGMVYTVSDVAFWSASTVISEDSQERTKLITAANIGVFAGIGFAGAAVPIISSQFNAFAPNITAMLTVLIMVVCLLLPFTLIGSRQLKERVFATSSEKVTFKKIFENLKSNKPLRFILAIYFLNFTMNIVQGVAIYFFKYNLGSEALFATYSLMTTFAAAGFLILPILTARFKKKNILLTILTLDVVLRVIFFIIGYQNVALTTLILGVLFAIYAITAPILSIMIAETVEYSEYQTGVRAEAVTFSGQTFAGKFSVAIAGALSGFLLSFINYQAGVSVQSEQTLLGLFIIVSILPAIASIARITILLFHKYDEDEHAIIVEKLAAKRS